jgi:hypothetical protein
VQYMRRRILYCPWLLQCLQRIIQYRPRLIIRYYARMPPRSPPPLKRHCEGGTTEAICIIAKGLLHSAALHSQRSGKESVSHPDNYRD